MGAAGDDTGETNAGSAYVFDATNGTLLQTLNNPVPVHSGVFGTSVAVSGSTILVRAPGNAVGTSHPGTAYVIDAATGNVLRELSHPSPPDYDFGSAVALSGGIAVVGEPYANGVLPLSGAAYVFDATTDRRSRERAATTSLPFPPTRRITTSASRSLDSRRETTPIPLRPVTLTFNGLGGNDSITITGGDERTRQSSAKPARGQSRWSGPATP